MRIMHGIGVKGLFLDHNNLRVRASFSELQNYLIYKLSEDIDADTDALIEEFTDNQYGPAAQIFRKWSNFQWGRNWLDMFTTKIQAGNSEAPLPAEFQDIDPEQIVTILPARYRGSPQFVLDEASAFGNAVPVDTPNGLPFKYATALFRGCCCT